MRRSLMTGCLFAVIAIAASAAAAGVAVTEADQDVQYRQTVFKNIGHNFKTLNDLVQSGATDADTVSQIHQAVSAIHDDADEPWSHFGADTRTTGLKTTAGDKIWSDPDGFKKAQDNFKAAVEKLYGVVNAPSLDTNALRQAIAATGGACKSCHETYRNQ